MVTVSSIGSLWTYRRSSSRNAWMPLIQITSRDTRPSYSETEQYFYLNDITPFPLKWLLRFSHLYQIWALLLAYFFQTTVQHSPRDSGCLGQITAFPWLDFKGFCRPNFGKDRAISKKNLTTENWELTLTEWHCSCEASSIRCSFMLCEQWTWHCFVFQWKTLRLLVLSFARMVLIRNHLELPSLNLRSVPKMVRCACQ